MTQCPECHSRNIVSDAYAHVCNDCGHESPNENARGPRFNEQSNIGKAKYVVNHHDGVKTHTDGSPFYAIAIFSNKRVKDRFVRSLVKQGYSPNR